MQNKKIFIFDVDGTLLPFKQEHLSDKTLEALSQLRENGYLVGIATGRNNSSTKRILNGFELDFLITSNGRHVEIHEEVIAEKSISSEVLERLIAFDKKHEVGLVFASSNGFATFHGINADGVNYLENLRAPLPIVDQNFHKEQAILAANIFCDDAVEAIYREAFPELAFVRHKNNGIDVMSAGLMKEKGIKVVLEYFNLDREDAVAFGDGLNDISMFEYVDGVALGVAHPELVAVAKDQIGFVEEDAIYHYLMAQKYI